MNSASNKYLQIFEVQREAYHHLRQYLRHSPLLVADWIPLCTSNCISSINLSLFQKIINGIFSQISKLVHKYFYELLQFNPRAKSPQIFSLPQSFFECAQFFYLFSEILELLNHVLKSALWLFNLLFGHSHLGITNRLNSSSEKKLKLRQFLIVSISNLNCSAYLFLVRPI